MKMGINFREIFSAFIVMFAVIDILGSVPIIVGMKENNKKFNPFNASW
ncbi:MAG TPA: MarC family protein, partial [Bacteroidales bacterium]|nr:MarC family protein [Bacteroidales bacterium]